MSTTTSNSTSAAVVPLSADPMYAILVPSAVLVVAVFYVASTKWMWMFCCRPKRVDEKTQRCCWDDGGVRGIEYHPAELKRLRAVGPCRQFLHHLLLTAALMPTDDTFRAIARHHRAACFCAVLAAPLLSVTLLLSPLRYGTEAEAVRRNVNGYSDPSGYEALALISNAACGLGAVVVGRLFWWLFASAPRGFNFVPRNPAEREAQRTCVQVARDRRFFVGWLLLSSWMIACCTVMLVLGLQIDHHGVVMRHFVLSSYTVVVALFVVDPVFCLLLVCCIPRCCGFAKPAAERLIHPGLLSWSMPGLASPLLAVQTEGTMTMVSANDDEDANDIKAGRVHERNVSDACDGDVAFDDELPEEATREERAEYVKSKLANIDEWSELPPETGREMSPVRVVRVKTDDSAEGVALAGTAAKSFPSSSSSASTISLLPNAGLHRAAPPASRKTEQQDIIDSFFGNHDDDDDFLPPTAGVTKSSVAPASPPKLMSSGLTSSDDDDDFVAPHPGSSIAGDRESRKNRKHELRLVSSNPLSNVQQRQLRDTKALDSKVSSTLDSARQALAEAAKLEQMAQMRKKAAEEKRAQKQQQQAASSKNGLLSIKGTFGGKEYAPVVAGEDIFMEALLEDTVIKKLGLEEEDCADEAESGAAPLHLHQQLGILKSRGLDSLLSSTYKPEAAQHLSGIRICQRGAVAQDRRDENVPLLAASSAARPSLRRALPPAAAAAAAQRKSLDELGLLDLPPSSAPPKQQQQQLSAASSLSPLRSSVNIDSDFDSRLPSMPPSRSYVPNSALFDETPNGNTLTRNSFVPKMENGGEEVKMIANPWDML